MSSDAGAATVALFNELYTDEHCFIAAAVVFMYDAFLMFDSEVAYFWTAKGISGAALLFFANKWISRVYYVMGLVQFALFPSDKCEASQSSDRQTMIVDVRSCSTFVIAVQAMEVLQFVPGAAFSALRAYVLSRSKYLGILVAALSLAPVGVNLVLYGYHISGENLPPFGCLTTDNTTSAFNLRRTFDSQSYGMPHAHPQDCSVVIISRVPLIVADVVLIYVTVTKLRGWAALTDIRQSKRPSLQDILFRGGIIYFAITVILISRFLLALQETNHMVVKLDADDPLHASRNAWDSSTPSFISSLGGFINPELAA
ncbi:hypothetical protein K466DRAFT_605442 [Polyporus arcularius HHB13444]|uniref:DUF6533 domain-containing protein n=1 Tax=Polyporus arcularius HHB13444 TaxID=1314778 RepID=A0A5C3NWD4_9APHY|nr:hypothetical protein K466DRAFT_605442 [Polyporus arcularius HHB13444]